MSTSYFKYCYIFLLICSVLNSSCYNISRSTPPLSDTITVNKNFIAGVNMEAPPNEIDSSCFINMKRINARWVAFIPFAFSRQGQPAVQYNASRQWWGEREEGIVACIKMAHAQNMKVMLKPQIWIGGGVYTGHFKMETDTGWLRWEENYKNYILHNAKIAEEYQAEIFCIGTEMDEAVKLRPLFWENLIDSVKKIYKGELTYAANWGCFKEFKSWDKLEYIGIDAYFPLSPAVTPTVDELFTGWQLHFEDIKQFEKVHKKPILFTEYGYRSIDKAAHEPWSSYNKAPINFEAQQNAYEALYKRFLSEPWFAGGFLWKWHVNDAKAGGKENSNYTPQNKPVEEVIKKWYKLSI